MGIVWWFVGKKPSRFTHPFFFKQRSFVKTFTMIAGFAVITFFFMFSCFKYPPPRDPRCVWHALQCRWGRLDLLFFLLYSPNSQAFDLTEMSRGSSAYGCNGTWRPTDWGCVCVFGRFGSGWQMAWHGMVGMAWTTKKIRFPWGEQSINQPPKMGLLQKGCACLLAWLALLFAKPKIAQTKRIRYHHAEGTGEKSYNQTSASIEYEDFDDVRNRKLPLLPRACCCKIDVTVIVE